VHLGDWSEDPETPRSPRAVEGAASSRAWRSGHDKSCSVDFRLLEVCFNPPPPRRPGGHHA
jgi:hypothetical protein